MISSRTSSTQEKRFYKNLQLLKRSNEVEMGKPTEEQRPVIENASANNMVIAAPGSGKSFTMIEAVIWHCCK
ncbi:hypothetical protein NB16F78_46090 [Escherichia coli]